MGRRKVELRMGDFGFWDTLGGSENLGLDDDLSYRHEDNAMLFVASHGHPAKHGVMNTGVYLPRGMHCGVQGDMHMNKHANMYFLV